MPMLLPRAVLVQLLANSTANVADVASAACFIQFPARWALLEGDKGSSRQIFFESDVTISWQVAQGSVS